MDDAVKCMNCDKPITFVTEPRSRFFCGCGRGVAPKVRPEDIPKLAHAMTDAQVPGHLSTIVTVETEQ